MIPSALIASAIGSFTALVIAFFAYPWQKNRDRKLAILSEKRQVYVRFLERFNELDKWVWGWEASDHLAYNSMRNEFSLLYLYAPSNVIEACAEAYSMRTDLIIWMKEDEDSRHSTYGKDYSTEIGKAIEAEQKMVRLLREDLTGERLSRQDLIGIHSASAFGETKKHNS